MGSRVQGVGTADWHPAHVHKIPTAHGVHEARAQGLCTSELAKERNLGRIPSTHLGLPKSVKPRVCDVVGWVGYSFVDVAMS